MLFVISPGVSPFALEFGVWLNIVSNGLSCPLCAILCPSSLGMFYCHGYILQRKFSTGVLQIIYMTLGFSKIFCILRIVPTATVYRSPCRTLLHPCIASIQGFDTLCGCRYILDSCFSRFIQGLAGALEMGWGISRINSQLVAARGRPLFCYGSSFQIRCSQS